MRTPLDSQSSRTVCANHSQREICRNSMESATFKASAITEDHKNIRTNTFTSFTPSWPESYTRSLGVSWSLLSLHAVRRAHQQKGARTPGGLRRSHSHTPNTVFSAQIHAPFLVSRPSNGTGKWLYSSYPPPTKNLCWSHPNQKKLVASWRQRQY